MINSDVKVSFIHISSILKQNFMLLTLCLIFFKSFLQCLIFFSLLSLKIKNLLSFNPVFRASFEKLYNPMIANLQGLLIRIIWIRNPSLHKNVICCIMQKLSLRRKFQTIKLIKIVTESSLFRRWEALIVVTDSNKKSLSRFLNTIIWIIRRLKKL